MRTDHQRLLERLENYTLDDAAAALPFSERLARDHGWPLAYAQRVITEYKRFVFLAATAGHPVTPSPAVDEAWHLHLLHTDTYWNHFCPEILGTSLHHHPSRGGRNEHDKFTDWYGSTCASYRKFFNEEPPSDVWPASHHGVILRQVNLANYWIIPKPSWHLALTKARRRAWYRAVEMGHAIRRLGQPTIGLPLLLAAFCLLLGGCNDSGDSGYPLDLKGADFLHFYAITGLMGFLLAFLLRRQLRGPDGNGSDVRTFDLDPYAISFMAGGKALTLSAALTNLCQRGLIQISSCFNRVAVTKAAPTDLHPVEQTVYECVNAQGMTVRELRQQAADAVGPLEQRLRDLQLVPSAEQRFWGTWLPLALAAAVPVVGLMKIWIGLQRGQPIMYLVVLSLAAITLLVLVFARPPRRMRRGDQVLARLREEHAPLRSSIAARSAESSSPDLGLDLPMAIGLFGMGVLSGTSLDELRKKIAPPAGASSGYSGGCGGGDGGGGGGGGGGCGGGCGGCGGCGG